MIMVAVLLYDERYIHVEEYPFCLSRLFRMFRIPRDDHGEAVSNGGLELHVILLPLLLLLIRLDTITVVYHLFR